MKKICKVCGREFEAKGKQKCCSKKCSEENTKEYYKRPEVKEKRKVKQREYRQIPEIKKKIKERNINFYQEHREEILSKSKEWEKENKEQRTKKRV